MKTFLLALCLLVLPLAVTADVAPAVPDFPVEPGVDGDAPVCVESVEASLFPEGAEPRADSCTQQEKDDCEANCFPGCFCDPLFIGGTCYCQEYCP